MVSGLVQPLLSRRPRLTRQDRHQGTYKTDRVVAGDTMPSSYVPGIGAIILLKDVMTVWDYAWCGMFNKPEAL